MLNLTTIARPYAIAAFCFSLEKQSLKEWDLMLLKAVTIIKIKEIKLITTGVLGISRSTEMFLQLCQGQFDHYFINFIKIIINNKRLFLLKTIYSLFIEYKNNYKNVININIITSKSIDNQYLDKLQVNIQKKINKKILINNIIDNTIIGGKIFKLKNNVMDDSIKNHLEQLNKFLNN